MYFCNTKLRVNEYKFIPLRWIRLVIGVRSSRILVSTEELMK